MVGAVEFFDRYHNWLYVGLLIFAGYQLAVFWRARSTLHLAPFNLVRDVAGQKINWSLSWLIMAGMAIVLVFLNSTYVAPNIPLLFGLTPTSVPVTPTSPPPTATSPPVIPGMPTTTPVGTATLAPTNTPVPLAGGGCSNPNATITSPLPGAVLGGGVEVLGTADTPNFAFYVLEVSTLGDNWLTVYTHYEPVNNGLLGVWNIDLDDTPPGEYAFRLIIFQSDGNTLEPCTIPITIGS